MPAFKDLTEALVSLHRFHEAALLHALAFLFISYFLCAIGVLWVETRATEESPVMYWSFKSLSDLAYFFFRSKSEFHSSELPLNL